MGRFGKNGVRAARRRGNLARLAHRSRRWVVERSFLAIKPVRCEYTLVVTDRIVETIISCESGAVR